MIEAVNSVVANASVLRGQAEQASVARSFTANPERVQEVVQAPYVSPYISMDINHNKAVLQIRDGDTGDVLKQFPSDTALEFRSRQVASQAAEPVEVPQAETAETSETPAPQTFNVPIPAAPSVNPQAQIAAAALSSTAAQAAAVSAPPTSGNVVVTA
jgi:hypothetical protein